jgi:polyisoprenoid-binding protein YceI
MKKFFLLILITATTNIVSAQVKYSVIKANVAFKIKNMGISTGGTIGGIQADIIFNKDKPETSAITATADVNTINTDNDLRDSHLKGDNFFDVARYPKITMKSVAIKHRNGNNYLGTFNVTIKDKTKQIAVPFTFMVNGAAAEFKGSFKLQRTDFGVGDSSMVLSNDVTVDIDIQTASS